MAAITAAADGQFPASPASAGRKPSFTSISYNRNVSVHTIANPVPTPEEMGDILGLSSDRVNAVRKIMSTPSTAKRSRSVGTTLRKAAEKKLRRVSGKK